MNTPTNPPILDGWALVLGASSGIGAASALALAGAGCDIVGVHLDRRGTKHLALHVTSCIERLHQRAWMYNVNAAKEAKRNAVLDDVQSRWAKFRPQPRFRVLLHSLAFGSLLPLIDPHQASQTSQIHLEMTHSVMAHSLVSWTQALVQRGMLGAGGRVLAMTSSGARSAWPGYGAVSAAKASLEAYVRQLAIELAPLEITVNALCAGVTETPALRKIPDHETMKAIALRKNPHGRLTKPEDVASAIVALAQPQTYWINGSVIHVDGGEGAAG